jgi:hypothetical protein
MVLSHAVYPSCISVLLFDSCLSIGSSLGIGSVGGDTARGGQDRIIGRSPSPNLQSYDRYEMVRSGTPVHMAPRSSTPTNAAATAAATGSQRRGTVTIVTNNRAAGAGAAVASTKTVNEQCHAISSHPFPFPFITCMLQLYDICNVVQVSLRLAQRSVVFLVIFLCGWGTAVVCSIYELSIGPARQEMDATLAVFGTAHTLAVALWYGYTNARVREALADRFPCFCRCLRNRKFGSVTHLSISYSILIPLFHCYVSWCCADPDLFNFASRRDLFVVTHHTDHGQVLMVVMHN